MSENLVIVESPAKAKTIEKFLGKDFKVMSSYGHIRDLKRRELSLDAETMEPVYEIPDDKKKVVRDLKAAAAKAKQVWLASDEDREGEAISWHLSEVLGLDPQTTPRIVFHEITKSAILHAIENPRHIDMNLVNAQQARRVLDRLVGFKISPVLWRKVKPSLSAGRVQSVAVKLIVEREREIQKFVAEPFYRVAAVFTVADPQGNDSTELKAELDKRFRSHDEALEFLRQCAEADFTVEAVQKKPVKRMPAPPFTTSTLQQEASRKLGFTVSQTMMVAQRLYEGGHITYMRTDSVNLSALALGTSKQVVTELYGKQYSSPRNFHVSTKGAQEAHEAIRPTYMDKTEIEGTQQERRLYELIWKRTAASQMAEAQLEKTSIEIAVESGGKTLAERFVAQGEVVVFDGFLKVYNESAEEDSRQTGEVSGMLPPLKRGDRLHYSEISSTERFTQAPFRYNEASLVHKMEELGIGRPSTYAPTISTIQQREYVTRGDCKGTERSYVIDTLKGTKISHRNKTEMAGHEKARLMPTDVGMVVNDFLQEHFPDIMDYNFTARVEQQFDSIADGKEEWEGMMRQFDSKLDPAVERVKNERMEHKAGERQLGTDPASGRPVCVKIGRFGPVVQIGVAGEEEKPRFSQLPKGMSMETISLDEALELFRLPRTLGEFEGSDVVIGAGKYGPYVLHNKAYTSLPKTADPLTIGLDEAIELIRRKREQDAKRHLRKFRNDPKLEVMQGRFGPYIAYDGKNYRMPKNLHDKVADLTYEDCMKIVEQAQEHKK